MLHLNRITAERNRKFGWWKEAVQRTMEWGNADKGNVPSKSPAPNYNQGFRNLETVINAMYELLALRYRLPEGFDPSCVMYDGRQGPLVHVSKIMRC